MKLTIKTKDIEIEYQDNYSQLEKEPKERIVDLIKTVYEYQAQSKPVGIVQTPPKPTTWEEALNSKQK